MKLLKAILLTLAVGVLLDIALDLMSPDRVMNGIFVVVVGILLVGMLLVGYGTLVRNGWGVNLKPVSCPCCNSVMPRKREPKSQRQKLWGGWTCEKCGCEMDKWGRQITPSG